MKLSLFAVLLVAIAAVQGAGAGQAQVRIELPAQLGIARAEVSLGDVASMETADLNTLKRLMALPLGPAPRAGEKAQLGRAELMRWIQLRTGLNAGQILWQGAATTELRRASAEITGAQVTAVASESLRAWLGGRSNRADIAVSTLPRDVAVPFGQSALRARPIPQDAPLARRMVVWVDVWVDDRFVRTVPVGFEVAAYGPAYVAPDDMPVGSRFDASVLKVREVELTGRVAPVLAPAGTAPEAGGSAQARRPLQAGKVLTRLDVESPPAVTRGDWVALRVRSGAIEMESRVEALQNGQVGQSVSVKPSTASVPILARVVGPGQVEVAQ